MRVSECVAALIAAVTIEIIATTLFSLSDSFQRPVIGMATLLCYGVSYYYLSMAFCRIPLIVAWAIWSGMGVLTITCIYRRYFGYMLTHEAWLGVGMIISGVFILGVAIKQSQ